MKSSFSSSWKSSVQRRKQRKYRYNAPYHIKGKFLSANLDKALREKYGTRSLRIRVGDKIKIVRGSSAGKEGKVERVDLQRGLVYVEKLDKTKPDGSKVPLSFQPSNLKITEVNLDDKKRKAKLEGSHGKESS